VKRNLTGYGITAPSLVIAQQYYSAASVPARKKLGALFKSVIPFLHLLGAFRIIAKSAY
jgi:hypothetical protein